MVAFMALMLHRKEQTVSRFKINYFHVLTIRLLLASEPYSLFGSLRYFRQISNLNYYFKTLIQMIYLSLLYVLSKAE